VLSKHTHWQPGLRGGRCAQTLVSCDTLQMAPCADNCGSALCAKP
jgi:hypothetical protein